MVLYLIRQKQGTHLWYTAPPPILGCIHIFHLYIVHVQHSLGDRCVLHSWLLPNHLHIDRHPLSTRHDFHSPLRKALEEQ